MATVLQTHKDYEEKPSELLSLPLEQGQQQQKQQHDCQEFTILTSDTNEMVCIKCGMVDAEETARYQHENLDSLQDARAFTAIDHNAGSGLFDSQTVQSNYVSPSNMGLAFALNNPRGKDFQHKNIKKQLQDSYKSGLVASSKGCHTEEDMLTGKVKIKFSRYDTSLLLLIKEKALSKCFDYGLDTVQQTVLSKEITRLYSSLCLTDISEYIILCSMLKYRHFLPQKEQAEIEKNLIDCIESIRVKLVSGCCSKKPKQP